MTIKASLKQLNPNSYKMYERTLEKKIKETLSIAGNLVRNTAIELINSGPKSGRRYGKHQASAPGQAPATDTGVLRNNIVVNSDVQGLVVNVESRAKYSIFLEFGTTKMKPRPFMFPALESNKPKIRRMLKNVKGKI
tara:strand:- start:2719 stop:3129 length:411 start_codon:yes stop_codon:yes gene_type:complete